MASEWDAFPKAEEQPSGISEWDAFPKAGGASSQMQRGNLIDAVVDPVLSLGSAMIAKPAGDIAGLVKGWHDTQRRWAGLGQWGPNAEETQQAVQHAIQYQPTTQVGASKLNPLNAIPAAIGGAIGFLQPDAVTGEQATTLGGAAQNAVREAIPQAIGIAGVKYGPGATNAVGQAAKRGAQATMVNAIKATPTEIMSGDAALAAQELLKRGINPNTAGVVELNKIINDLHGQVESTIAGSTASVSKQAVLDSLQRVKDSFMYKPNLPANQTRIAVAGEEFAANPVIPANKIPVQVAQKLKRGYQKSVAEDYGVESTAGLEANKQIAQSLRQQIERAHPEVGPLNAEQAKLIDTLRVVERRAAMAQNEGLVPHVSPLGGAAAQTAMILNRNPWLRANLAQGLNKIGNLLSKSPDTAPLSRIVQINKDIPYNGLPPVPGSNVIPGSWREGLDRGAGARPLPVMSEDLLPNGAGGALRTPDANGPLPQLPPIDPLGLPPVLNTPAIAPVTEAPSLSMPQLARRSLPVPEVELQKLGIKADNVVDAQNIIQTRISKAKSEYADWAKSAADRFRAEQAAALNERANNPAVLSGAERAARKVSNSESFRRMDLEMRSKRAEMQARVDELEAMSERLAAPRSGTAIDLGQGPKTRGALRDLLTP